VGAPLISPSWVVAGVILLMLVGIGVLLFSRRGGSTTETVQTQPTLAGQGAEQAQPTAGPGASSVVAQAGTVPNLQGQNVLVAIDSLQQAGLKFFVIEVQGSDSQTQTVMQQSPSPGSAVSRGDTVTLVVGR